MVLLPLPPNKTHPCPGRPRCPAAPWISKSHLKGRRSLSGGWLNPSPEGQPEAMAPHQLSPGMLVAAGRAMLLLVGSATAARGCPPCMAGQGQGACRLSQLAWAGSVITGTMGTMAHSHMQRRGLQTEPQELSRLCWPQSVPSSTDTGWRGGIQLYANVWHS